MTRAAIFGLAGTELTKNERSFFRQMAPLGFILFGRNCVSVPQVRALTDELRDLTGRADTAILIDQEGGRVARLGPPHWRKPPAAARFAAAWRRDPDLACEAVRANARLIADELHAIGVTVDCAPVLDVPGPGSHEVIGDRAFGAVPQSVSELGRAMAEGLLAGGVLPVIKHIPGHGRASADSHRTLPKVGASRADLEAVDFAPFRALRRLPLAMTAHVLYQALDAERAATTSPTVIGLIRNEIGFDGLLMSDDISSNMKALPGGYGERTRDCLNAGCDVVLHCSGKLSEMKKVATELPALGPAAIERWSRAANMVSAPPPVDGAALLACVRDAIGV
jgi:beta-N-acetylhexosaminidase